MAWLWRGITVLTVATALAVSGAGLADGAPATLVLPEPFATWLRPPATPASRLATSYAAFEKSLRTTIPGRVGVALVPIGTDVPLVFGSLRTGRAWSTMKVPVALAAQRRNGTAVAQDEDKAITFSDNDAASDLWGSLGGGRSSVTAVTAVLREGHDIHTRVSSEADTPASYPGATAWALADQAIFGAHLPCMPNSAKIIRLMSAVGPNQQWGIAELAGHRDAHTAVKGGWGPATDASSAYLVRQLGIITTGGGRVAVSMAARPRSGSFEDGTEMLTKVGRWLARNLALLPLGRCSTPISDRGREANVVRSGGQADSWHRRAG
ncbi:MAG: hypothetical protein QM673_12710 [Gordonia sp. (in: high G+C Gram-positive bacteria)]